MDLTSELHLAAGLAALALGTGALLRDPRRERNRLFALLCGALALWLLGVALGRSSIAPDAPWHLLFLLGSCAASPIGLHLSLALLGGGRPRWLLGAAYAAAGALWLSAWTPAYASRLAWDATALVVLGCILAGALVLLGNHVASLRGRPERDAYRLLLAGAAIATAGGLSDFLPRGGTKFPLIGPVTLILFLLVLCAVIVRHRFLDVNVFLVRSVALVAGSAALSALFYVTARLAGRRFLPIFLVALGVLAIVAPLARSLMSGTRTALRSDDPVARALVDVSRRIQEARRREEVGSAIEEGRRALPGDVNVAIYARPARGKSFVPVYGAAVSGEPRAFPRSGALPRVLEAEREPVTRRYLDDEARSIDASRSSVAREALGDMTSIGAEIAIPLLRGDHLLGWIVVGGGLPERYLTAEVAAAFLALGNQAVASLERIGAVEESKRREALAAVGGMAAGLAHEIRNPLGAIRGAAQVLAGDVDPERGREMLGVIEEETERLGRVVGEFLEYARPAPPAREPVDLADLAARVLRAAGAAGSPLRTTVEVAPGTARAVGDPNQLARAFGNLVTNAGEAAGPGGSLLVAIAPGGDGRVEIRFEDDGPGIAPDQIPGIFQPFHTTKQGGTGLGLALVHRVVESHGGEIRVEGRPGAGAAFTIVLPAEEST